MAHRFAASGPHSGVQPLDSRLGSGAAGNVWGIRALGGLLYFNYHEDPPQKKQKKYR